MRIAKIAMVAIVALVSLWGCQKPKEDTPVVKKQADFTVALNPNTVESDYAEVVVRHNGAKDVAWYGFATEDLETGVADLIKAQLATLDRKALHYGNAQTVAVRSLEQVKTYRYIAFAVDEANETFGTPGSLAFSTSPVYSVVFTAEAAEVEPTEARFTVSHDGHEILTYAAFVSDDLTAELDELIAADYADKVSDGKLKDGVQLLSGNTATVSFSELTHATDYRFIVYGIYDDGTAVLQYGTPAECEFSTPLDLNLVNFSAETSTVLMETAEVAVSYDVDVEDLTWYGFVTEDVTSPAADLIAAAVADLPAEDWESGAKDVELSGLNAETTYRYIVTGINADGVYGQPADIQFTTLSAAYMNTVFTVEASDITSHGVTLTITHTGEAEFEYCGFFTEDLESPVDDIDLPEDADQHLMSGLEKVITIEDLDPNTEYRYVVVGRVNGVDYGTRGEVVFTSADNVIPMAYDDYIGEWKLNGQVFSITELQNGSTYTVTGFPGSSAAWSGVTTLVANYDSENGLLYVEDQDLAEFDEDEYGPCLDFVAGAVWTEMQGGSYQYWPVYPFQEDDKQGRIFSFVHLDDDSYVLRPAEGVEAVTIGVCVLTGEYAGMGLTYSAIELPTEVIWFDKAAASYEDFLGTWNLGDAVITISQKTAGSTYTVTGLSGMTDVLGGVTVATGNYDATAHEFYLMEQALGGTFDTADHTDFFGSNQYGLCDDYLAGMFHHSSGDYTAYPINTSTATRIFTAYFNTSGGVEIIPGSCTYGAFYGYDACWVIQSGDYAGKGNNYHKNGDEGILPATMTKVSGTAVFPSAMPKNGKLLPEVASRIPLKTLLSFAK